MKKLRHCQPLDSLLKFFKQENIDVFRYDWPELFIHPKKM